MANETKLKNLSVNALQEILDACNKTFQKELGTESWYSEGTTTWAIPEVGLNYKSTDSENLLKYLTNITGEPNIRRAYSAVNQELENKLSGKSEVVESNRPSKEQLETFEKEAEKREAERQKAISEANEAVRQAIAKQQEIHEKLVPTKPKVFVKADLPQAPQLTEKAQAVLDDLKKNPSIPNITNQLEKSIAPSLQNQLSEDQIHLIALDAAYKAVDAANNPGKYVDIARQAAILNAVAKDTEVLPKIIEDADILTGIRVGANELANFEKLQTATARVVWSGFDPDLGKTLFANANDFQIGLSQIQVPGYSSVFSPEGMVQGYTGFLENNVNFLETIAKLPIDKFQQQISLRATGWLNSQITTRFPNAAIFFTTPESQVVLGGLGIGTTTIELSGTIGSFFVENPEALPVINFLGRGLGISFSAGTGAAAGSMMTSTLATAQSMAIAGDIMASEAFLGGAGVAAASAAGQAAIPVPVVGAIIGAATAVVVPAVVKFTKDHAKVIGQIAVVLLGGAVGFFVGGGSILFGALGGAGGYLISGAFTGGLSGLASSASSIGSGVGTVASAAWTAFLAGVGTPIIAFFIGFPVAVALILFIINSGAYVVPQSTFQFGGPGGVTVECNTANAPQNPAAKAAVCIAYYLVQFHLNPLTQGLLGSSGWNSLKGVLPALAIDALDASAHVDGHLQCVGFVAATAGYAYGQPFPQINACAYINNAPSGYRYVSGTAGISSGDFFLIGSSNCSSGSPGHIGVVLSVDGALISCADANYIGPGVVRAIKGGCFPLSQLAGYLRKK